jgi:hypothetical protein
MEFWDKVKQSGHKEPGHKVPMGQLNDMRVSLRHKGILPRPQSVRDLFPRIEIFCEEVTKDLLQEVFGEFSLADLVADDEVRNDLRAAIQALNSSDKNQAFINVRTAFDKLHRLISKDIPLIDEPHRLRSSRREIPKNSMDDLSALHEVLSYCVETLNVSMLGIDPIRYRSSSTIPRISPGLSQDFIRQCSVVITILCRMRFFTPCFEFVVDVALNASR